MTAGPDEVFFAVLYCSGDESTPAGLHYSFSAAAELNLIRLPVPGSHLPLKGKAPVSLRSARKAAAGY